MVGQLPAFERDRRRLDLAVYRIGERRALKFADPYEGVECEVDTLNAYPIYALVVAETQVVLEAEDVGRRLAGLRELYRTVEAQARPVWNLVEGTLAIPATAVGMLRVPVPLMLRLVDLWTDTFDSEGGVPSQTQSVSESRPPASARRRRSSTT